MAAGKYKIFVEQGATYTLNFTLYNGNTVWNLTGYTARLQARDSIEDSATIFSATDANYITLGGNLGTFQMVIPAAITAGLPDGHFIYDLELVSGTTVYRVIQGAFVVSPEVTR